MSLRRVVVAAVAVLAIAAPAYADDYHLGLSADYVGTVLSASVDVTVDVSLPGRQSVGAQCTFYGQTGLHGGFDFQYAGEAVSNSTSVIQPMLTDVKCTLTSPTQGLPGEEPEQSASFEVACPLYACATASAVSTWPQRPVVVCVDGYAIFGPTPVVRKDVVHQCVTKTLP